MSDTVQWGYAQHESSILDVTDHDEWRRQEVWAIDNALTYARLEQIPGLPCMAPGPDFMEFFESMLDANLHHPLDICTANGDECETEGETEQTTLMTDGGQKDDDTEQCERCRDGEATARISVEANYDGAMTSQYRVCNDCVRSLGDWYREPGAER